MGIAILAGRKIAPIQRRELTALARLVDSIAAIDTKTGSENKYLAFESRCGTGGNECSESASA